jgi:hypothetical protein
MLAASVLIASLLASSKFEKRFRAAAQKAQRSAPPQAGAVDRSGKNVKNLRNARIRWDEIAIVLVLIGGIGVYLFMTRDARRSLRPLQQRRREAVSRALDDSIDDLRRDPDVRRAIVAAYARMEAALAHAGVPRAAAETPYEYLERSLVELDAGAEGARRLTDLFERAKFSHHEPAESMRDEAVGMAALMRIMREVRRDAPSRFEVELGREQIPPGRPNALVRIERELTLATSNAGNVHDRLRPMLQEIAQARLGRDATRERLGDETWELIRPDAPEPRNRSASGLSLRTIRRVIESLERA